MPHDHISTVCILSPDIQLSLKTFPNEIWRPKFSQRNYNVMAKGRLRYTIEQIDHYPVFPKRTNCIYIDSNNVFSVHTFPTWHKKQKDNMYISNQSQVTTKNINAKNTIKI